ncbi:cadg domain containing protein [Stylonychia lemnae]|uniref:Cadg domain containing protein n=1 Tax=Stylonychia lemnae TaxID=5949 RepID=A0A078A397_STYLE|nr:cadg domain containing protein [Stylonychia lemnae]|eukprot:CDW76642.1 cadg domain containing protein [Stylonychia lemnae]
MIGRINNEQSAEVAIQLTAIGVCTFAQITSTTQSNIEYFLNSGSQSFTLDNFNINTTSCPITYTLTKISSAASSNFFTFTSSSRNLIIQTTLVSDIGTFIFELKGKNPTGSSQATQQLSIQIKHECEDDEITPSTVLPQYNYLIESGLAQSQFTLSWTHTNSQCGSIITYQVVNQANNSTIDAIFYIEDSIFYVFTTDELKIGTYNLRIIAGTAYKSLIQNFIVVVETDCPNAVVTSETIIDKTYTLGSPIQTFQFICWGLSQPECGPIVYTLLIDSSPKPSWVSFDSTSRTISFETSDSSATGTKIFQITGTTTISSISQREIFQVEFINPCNSVILSLSNTISNQVIYLNESPVKTLALPAITQSSSTIDCGLIIQTITTDQNNPVDSNIFTYHLSNNSITMFSKDKTKMIYSPFKVKVVNRLQAYPAISQTYQFSVSLLIDCQFDYLTASTVQSVTYVVKDQYSMKLSDYIQSFLSDHCGTISQYQCTDEFTLLDCANNHMITFNTNSGLLIIETQDANKVGIYKLQIVATHNNKQATQSVNIAVTKDCRSAVITKSALSALSFDISNGTKNYITDIPWTNDMIA